MRRVVITGMGITSCLGNDLDTVSAALREGRSGITAWPTTPKRACAARSAVASTSTWRR
jgi:3-oxoacyl-(acyl-carrier-protein) synthase